MTGEAQALLGVKREANERNVLLSNFLAVAAIVSGTSYWFAVLPAFEHDPRLYWTPQVTMLVATVACVAENIGNLLLGPLADSISPSFLLTVNAVFMVSGIVFELWCQHAWQLALAITMVCVVKGIMWPAVCALVGQNIAPARHDVAFLLSALGSRSAETVSKMFIGRCMDAPIGLGWRPTVALLLFGIVIILSIATWLRPPGLVEASKRDLVQSADIDAVGKWRRLIFSREAWLQWFILLSAGMIWSLNSYAGLLLMDVYGTSVGIASSGASAIPSGMAVGLAIGAAASGSLDAAASHAVHVLQIAVGAAALGVLALYPNLQLNLVFFLFFLGGFGGVVPCYLPSLKYSASGSPDEKAFRLSVLWATNATVGTLVTYYFGSLRDKDFEPTTVASLMYGSTSVGLLIAGLLVMGRSCVVPKEKVDARDDPA